MSTLWDDRFITDPVALENWLYGKQSLSGMTRDWFINEVKKWPKNTTLLDAGCGGGVTGYQLQNKSLLDNIRYTGLDGSVCMLDLAKKKVTHKNASWVLSSLDTFSSETKFDKILLRAVIEHNLDPRAILTSVAAALKPGGALYVIFWNNPVFEGDAVIKKIRDGFYDNSHKMSDITDTLEHCRVVLTRKEWIKEQSEGSKERFIAVFTKA